MKKQAQEQVTVATTLNQLESEIAELRSSLQAARAEEEKLEAQLEPLRKRLAGPAVRNGPAKR
jgi:septal ring factor EnvC (AmiA/AmiB activator)